MLVFKANAKATKVKPIPTENFSFVSNWVGADWLTKQFKQARLASHCAFDPPQMGFLTHLEGVIKTCIVF
jgi:hypothetical protein